ncbi:ACT domain-containing protein [bacterium]|nr:MAG: ACT domain-containing protein [bacterium]
MRDLRPSLLPDEFVFVRADAWDDRAVAACREEEGLTLVMPRSACPDGAFPCRRIVLRTVTDLSETGVMAWVATRLAEAGIPCNLMAGFYHDHLFVPAHEAERAVEVLRQGPADSTSV